MEKYYFVKNVKEANTGDDIDFIVGETYRVESNDKFGVYVISQSGESVYFEDEEEFFMYFEIA